MVRVLPLLLAAAVVCGAFLQTGCTVAAYGIGVATMVNDMKVRQQEDYTQYRAEMDADNAARAKSGLSPDKPLSFRQWVRQRGN